MTCVLCGTSCSLETRATANVRSQVLARYKEDPFSWKALECADPDRDSFCAHCLNHIRKRKRQKARGMLPMDQFLLFLLCPGHVSALDQRCCKRLWVSIGQKTNPYRHTGVQPLDNLIESHGCMHTWWSQNLSTNFFRSKRTASMVRGKIGVQPT